MRVGSKIYCHGMVRRHRGSATAHSGAAGPGIVTFRVALQRDSLVTTRVRVTDGESGGQAGNCGGGAGVGAEDGTAAGAERLPSAEVVGDLCVRACVCVSE